MAPIRYSLHYEDYSEHLMSRFGKLLQIQSLVDMTLMCSSHTLRVHKAVLAASSAYFQEVLQKQMGEPLIILKMRFSVLKCLVEFMYCGKTQCLEENLDELVSAAQFLKIKGLSKVTKEGLGIADSGELPVFTPPVVINRPPQSLIDLHSQEGEHKTAQTQLPPTSNSQPLDAFGRPSKDTVVRIPFDIENGNSSSNVDYPDMPRAIKPRRGRPTVRRSGGWEGAGSLSRAAERALLRREQDSRKAIHQLKHLQTRHMQDYMDRVTLSQAVNSICGPETSSNSYMNMESDLLYMDQGSSNIDPNMSFGKDNTMKDTMPTSYPNASSSSAANDTGDDGINNAMSQYVNALKNAGLPTDLPILFESGDGSYINVNEQVLLDMVQSSEIQYEVIEQPNIIEKVADPSEIKSIDDLSKSIERGEMMQGSKGYSLSADFDKDTDFNRTDDGMNSLNNILPDNLEAYGEQQNFVVMDPRLQENNSLDHVSSNDFSCIDGDMQFFTKSMSDDVKKYYEDQQLVEARVMEQLCPTSTSLDTNFSMSLLDTKSSQLNENLSQSYDTLNTDDLRRTEDCYDFTLPLPQSNVFKEDLDCLIATPRRNDDDGNSFEINSQLARERAQAKADIIKDLMSIESKMNLGQETNSDNDKENSHSDSAVQDFGNPMEDNAADATNFPNKHADFSAGLTPNMQWMDMDDCRHPENDPNNENSEPVNAESKYSMIDLTDPVSDKAGEWDDMGNGENDKENEAPETNEIRQSLDPDIPFAVGLLPMKPSQQRDDTSLLKRRSPVDLDSDAKCLKRRAKKKYST